MYKKIIKRVLGIGIAVMIIVLAGIWASRKTYGSGVGGTINLDFEYNNYTDGLCKEDIPCRFEKKSCGLEIRYTGTLIDGTVELVLYDEADQPVWNTVLTEAQNYDETIYLNERGYKYSLVYIFPEGSHGNFELSVVEQIYNYQRFVNS